ncbi:MAG: sigma-70 family RNA polymerase sigma factor [Lachnospiraceae bacterium]|nr:sigma-70 family RNA polymerase sigma factor [Lachnospiraceae bacterium]
MNYKTLQKKSDEDLLAVHAASKDIEERRCVENLLVDRYKNLVRSVARKYFLLGGEEDDLIQEGMVGLFSAIQDYRPGKNAKFSTFAHTCVFRRIKTVIDRANENKHKFLNNYVSIFGDEEEGDGALEIPDTGAGPEESILSQERTARIGKAIEEILTPVERQCFTLYLTGKTCSEVAAELGKDPKSTDNAIQRARKKLQTELQKQGI